ncbi:MULTISPECIES: DUF421 domain-containing protein [Caproicibacterium]|uniref:DUF421 domain-containing protein n=1 Tax=Caproicibacterium argilliputei TaxID=3030016 RepID=A0AA97D9C6_9FIRM|nr:DUF421 domain-containing protein [Caproicibacterium argilliputei]WOC31837.1 DUF421 domain-containing protein [Caproicibacterium argilliputei]
MEVGKLILSSLLSVVVLFILGKLMGHKQIAQLDFFDYITGITIGSIAAELATELENPWQPLLAMLVYGLLSVGLSVLEDKVPRIRQYTNGVPAVIMDHGKLNRQNMKKAKLDLSEFLVLCRQAGYFDLNDIQTAIFEYNGSLTILPVSTQRPTTPADWNLSPQQETYFTEIILDGRVQGRQLKKLGLSQTWLEEQLQAQGYHSAAEVYLGLCDKNNAVQFYTAK